MQKPYRYPLIQVRQLLFLVGFAALVATGCQREAGQPETLAALLAEEGPDQESWGVRFIVSEVTQKETDSRLRMVILADYMALFERDSTYRLLQGHPDSVGGRVRVYLFDEAGDSSATLTADRVFYYDDEKRFDAQGNVIVHTPKERLLESEQLLWHEEDRKVRTPGFVRITTPNRRVQGYGLVAEEDLATYELRRPVGQVDVEEDTG